jgi:acid phosphatase (class A)
VRYPQKTIILSILALTACASAPAPDASSSASGAAAATAAANGMPGERAAGPRGGGSGAPARPRDTTPPYFGGDTSNFFHVMPPAPKNGDARDRADRQIFRQTRKLAGSPRWQMAADDAELGNAAMLKHYACSLGVEATPEQLPKTVALLQKATREAARTVGTAKEFYARKRPFLVDKGKTCVPEATIGKSFDYPSGHTTAGWAWAMVLAAVDTEHAEPILKRGRAIGDSRVVCGMHNASAVEAARLLTSSAMTVISASELYQSDVRAAREELTAFRATGPKPDPQRCALEAELVEANYW